MIICQCGNLFTPLSSGNSSKMCSSCVTNRRRFSIKERAVEYLGGKCIDCGYNKCLQALEFDHVDPMQKEFTISGGHCFSWEKIKNELDKCVLRCANCHRERHATERVILKEYEFAVSTQITVLCNGCNTPFSSTKFKKRKFCSVKCAKTHITHNKKIVWPNVQDLTILIQQSSFTHVASTLGVSDNGLRKYLIRNNINPKDVRSIKDNKFIRP
jgi:hypothetical protein